MEKRNLGTIYISGPMTGLSKEEYTAKFQNAYNYLKEMGFQPYNPSTLNVEDSKQSYKEILLEDLQTLSYYDSIYMLKGYENSKGACAEMVFAYAIGIPIIFEDDITRFNQVEV